MNQLFREYFTYTSIERRSVLVLLGLIALLLVFLGVSKFFLPKERADFSSFEKEVEALHAAVKTEAGASFAIEAASNDNDKDAFVVEHFPFDPNTATSNDLQRLGLSSRQSKAILAYVSKGGKFRTKEDFKKMKVITSELYAALQPYISIAPKEKPVENAVIAAAPALIDVNTADSLSLISIDGIGPVFASRIMKFRKALGGFTGKEQLKEVRGMTDEAYNFISQKITIDASAVKKININTCTVEDLKKHPYITYNIARALVNYRAMHGNYRKIEDIRASDLVNDELYRKIAPYLTAE